MVFGNGQVQQPIQSVDDPLQTAAVREVDRRIAIGDVNIAGADHIGTAEIDHGVAVGMRGGLMQQLDRLAVEVQILAAAEVGIAGLRNEGNLGLAGRRIDHALEHVIVRQDLHDLPLQIARRVADVALILSAAEAGQRFVASGVLGMEVGVDDVAERLVGQLADRRQNFLRQRRGSGIHQQHSRRARFGR